jgi:hypothetical protein
VCILSDLLKADRIGIWDGESVRTNTIQMQIFIIIIIIYSCRANWNSFLIQVLNVIATKTKGNAPGGIQKDRLVNAVKWTQT